MRKAILLFLLGFFVYSDKPCCKYPFLNPELPLERRIDDLISRLTLREKASLMLYSSPPIPRLGIPAYNWWNEALHGVARAGRATVFPQAIALAATFDDDLLFRIATAISDEARAKYNVAVEKGNRVQYMGLTFWSPNINIFRDPRWGRGQETYGEDPYLTSRMGIAFVKGLQGKHPRYLKTAACAKHFVVHSGPEKLRHRFNAVPPERDFYETYLLPFRALVREGNVAGVMCAYNRTYGIPCCGSSFLLKDILRQWWGFDGYVVSDCWALDDIWAGHKTVDTEVEAAAMALKAGVNLNCGYIYKYLPEAVRKGVVKERDIDRALRVLLKIRFRLGQFDPPELNPYSRIPAQVVNCAKHRKLAYEAAAKSIVLLENKNHVLPLDKKKIKDILLAGPTCADVNSLLGNYNGYAPDMKTILEGVVDRVDEGTVVEYSQGFLFGDDDPAHFRGFWEARRADAVIACIGINYLFEGEEGDAVLNPNGGDRRNIGLPANQVEYIKKLREKIGNIPLIVVITGGSPISIPEISKIADAILFVWYPGEQGGEAVADVIFGDVNPAGRLPVTFYRSIDDLPPFEDYSMEGRTYRYFRGKPLYPFGYGLSYTTFEYIRVDLDSKKIPVNGSIGLRVTLRNAGKFDGDEVVQVYASKPHAVHFRPIKQLVAFKRIFVKQGQTLSVRFEIPVRELEYRDIKARKYRIENGEYELQIGASSADIRLTKRVHVLSSGLKSRTR